MIGPRQRSRVGFGSTCLGRILRMSLSTANTALKVLCQRQYGSQLHKIPFAGPYICEVLQSVPTMWFEHRHVLTDIPTTLLILLVLLVALFFLGLLAQTYILYLQYELLNSLRDSQERRTISKERTDSTHRLVSFSSADIGSWSEPVVVCLSRTGKRQCFKALKK